MMDVIESIAQFVADQTPFLPGSTLQIKYTDQEAPPRCVTILNRTGGETYFDLKDRVDFMLQIITRADDINDAEADMNIMYQLFHGLSQKALYNVEYQGTNQVSNGDFELWAGANAANNWTKTKVGTSELYREATIKKTGSFAAKMTIDAGNNQLKIMNTLVNLWYPSMYKLWFWYLQSTAGKTFKLQLRSVTDVYYFDFSTGLWSAVPSELSLLPAANWTKQSFEVRTFDTYSDYHLEFAKDTSASSSLYIDDVWMEWAKYEIQTSNSMGWPGYIGQDDHGRHQFSANFVLRIKDYVIPDWAL